MNPGRRRRKGLTLVEVLIVVLIIAVLAALAVPSYQRYLQRGHRADAIRGLMQIAGCQERVRAATGYYDTGRCTEGLNTPAYRFRIEPAAQASSLVFTAIATPDTTGVDDDCGELSLDQAGTRGIGGNPQQLAACWGGR